MTNSSSLRWVCALLVLVVSLASVGCDNQYQPVDRQPGQFTTQQLQQLYVGNVGTQSAPTPSIGIFNALNGLNSVGSVQVEGPPMALAQGPTYTIFGRLVFGTLYAALGTGSVLHFRIDGGSGGLSLIESHPVGSIPSALIATATNLHVANRGSNSISVFTIDSSGGLALLRTVGGTTPADLALDPICQVLVSSGGGSFCTFQIRAGGNLSAPDLRGSVAARSAARANILFVDSVLYMIANSAVRPVSELEAWRVDAATGIFTRVAMPIPFGALTLYGFAKVPGVDAVYVARTGGVSQVVLPASPSFTFTVAAHNSVTGVPAGIFADPRGGRLFVTDTAQNRVTSLSVGSGGAVATSVVAAGTPGQKFARSMAMFNR